MNIHLSATTLWSLLITLGIVGVLKIATAFPTENWSDEQPTPGKVLPKPQDRNHNKTHHHHPDNQFWPKSSTIPSMDISLIHEHRMIVMQDFEAKEQEMIDLIKMYGFDEAVNIFVERVLVSLKHPPTANDRATVKESLMKALFNHELLKTPVTIPVSISNQQLSNANPENVKTSTKTPHSPLATQLPMTTTVRNQDDHDVKDEILNATPPSQVATTLPSQNGDGESVQ